MAAPDLGEKRRGLDVVERVAPDEHGVEHDPERPDVGRLPRVTVPRVEDLGTDVGRTAVLVGQVVIALVV